MVNFQFFKISPTLYLSGVLRTCISSFMFIVMELDGGNISVILAVVHNKSGSVRMELYFRTSLHISVLYLGILWRQQKVYNEM